MGIEIDVLWNTDETALLEDAGLDVNPDDLDIRTMTFYRIDAISPNHAYGKEFCNIHAGGDVWITPHSYEYMKRKINDTFMVHINVSDDALLLRSGERNI